MEGNNLPLALNPWEDLSAPNSFGAANEAVDVVFDPENDEFLREHPHLTQFVHGALYALIVKQSAQNFEQYRRLPAELAETRADYVRGIKDPADLVLFLNETPQLESIEIARRTTKEPNVFDVIDRPVRSNLDNHPDLQTDTTKSASVYRIKNLNLIDTDRQHFMVVDRKRTVRRHFGGEVLTIVRNSYVLHNEHDKDKLPVDLIDLVDRERESARKIGDYNYDRHSDTLHRFMEDHVTHRSNGERPGWMMPVMTTYYAAMRHAVTDERLLKVDESISELN